MTWKRKHLGRIATDTAPLPGARRSSRVPRTYACRAVLAIVLPGCCVSFAAGLGQSPHPEQRAKDQAAFAAARAITDPEQRLATLRQFADEFPASSLHHRAITLALETCLTAFPERTEDIHSLARRDIDETAAGLDRALRGAQIADMLADAGTGGADLADADLWSESAVHTLTEEGYRREVAAVQVRYGLPRLTAEQVRRDFARDRAACLAALANVQLRQARAAAAAGTLSEAYRLDPLSSEVNRLRGQLALREHQDGPALQDFERAEALGGLKEPWRSEMLSLYTKTRPGGEPELEADIDTVYEQIYPAVFRLPRRELGTAGHTVLLELFTGSGCDPCVGPDLAADSLLYSYPRSNLVVLEYDEHIPRPDPLANPASVARASVYGVGTTPLSFLDGEAIAIAGSTRGDVENIVVGLADAIEDRADEPSPARIALTAMRGKAGVIDATAVVSMGAGQSASEGARSATGALRLRPVLHFALVEDHVRYSGENGVRLHRMAVRSLERTALRGYALDSGGVSMLNASFDPAEIASELASYLTGYETKNDRFGQVRFLSKEVSMQPDQLAVVAWIEDTVTHQVLQTAFTQVSSP